MNKKTIIITAAITSILVFLLTTAFYLTPLGKLLFFEVSGRLAGMDYAKLYRVERIIDDNYIGDYSKQYLTDNAIEAYVASVGDPYTSYFNKENFAKVQESLSNDYKGIGITVVADNGLILVTDVAKGSPAEKGGVLKGDYLVAVKGVRYTDAELDKAVSVIKSTPEGKKVKITVQRNGSEHELDITVRKVDIENIHYYVMDDGIGYIRIDTFAYDLSGTFFDALKDMESQGIKALLIDVRDNPGGVLDEVVKMTDLLLPECTITSVKDKNGNEDIYYSDEYELEVPMAILVNESSASASEIMAGALKDNGKGVLVGKKTFGKGVVQGMYELGDGSAVRVTIAQYFTPSGVCINGTGIEPDYDVELPEVLDESMPYGGDTQLAKAVEVLKKDIK